MIKKLTKLMLLTTSFFTVTSYAQQASSPAELDEALKGMKAYIEMFQEKMYFIKLISFGKNKNKVIKALREIMPVENFTEKNFIEVLATFPLPEAEAQEIKALLEAAGATIELIIEKVE
ncbi:MAG: ribosomal protein L7/L12 [Candidatus Babeliaceae bacterium]